MESQTEQTVLPFVCVCADFVRANSRCRVTVNQSVPISICLHPMDHRGSRGFTAHKHLQFLSADDWWHCIISQKPRVSQPVCRQTTNTKHTQKRTHKEHTKCLVCRCASSQTQMYTDKPVRFNIWKHARCSFSNRGSIRATATGGRISGTGFIMRDSGLTVKARSAGGYLSSVNPLHPGTAAPNPASR